MARRALSPPHVTDRPANVTIRARLKSFIGDGPRRVAAGNRGTNMHRMHRLAAVHGSDPGPARWLEPGSNPPDLVRPSATLSFPDISAGIHGRVDYTASTGQLTMTNTPYIFDTSVSAADKYAVAADSNGQLRQTLNLKLDDSGNLLNDPAIRSRSTARSRSWDHLRRPTPLGHAHGVRFAGPGGLRHLIRFLRCRHRHQRWAPRHKRSVRRPRRRALPALPHGPGADNRPGLQRQFRVGLLELHADQLLDPHAQRDSAPDW